MFFLTALAWASCSLGAICFLFRQNLLSQEIKKNMQKWLYSIHTDPENKFFKTQNSSKGL